VHALATPVVGWLAATQARLGMPDEARATLTGFSAEHERMGFIYNARAVICLAEGELLSPPEELSPSELRVLRYLPTNLTRPEIARELYVSINTVNTHLRNIYFKLGAHDRSSAVRRARELRLLSTARS